MATQNETLNEIAQGEIILTREFNATCERVFQAWADPEKSKQWWGPKDFTAPVVKIDFRVGGKFLNCMKRILEQGCL